MDNNTGDERTMAAGRLMAAIVRLGDIGRMPVIFRTTLALLCMAGVVVAGSERVNWLRGATAPLGVVLALVAALPIIRAFRIMSLGLRAASNVGKYGIDPTPALGLTVMYVCDTAACVFMILLFLRGPGPMFPGML